MSWGKGWKREKKRKGMSQKRDYLANQKRLSEIETIPFLYHQP